MCRIICLFLSISCLGCLGCKQRGVQHSNPVEPDHHVLDFDQALSSPEPVKFSSRVSSISYIPLETNDSIPLPGGLNCVINGHYILVWDR